MSITKLTVLQGLDEIIPGDAIDQLATSNKQLTIKWGADPSAPDLHFGHMVVLNKCRQLQELGHHIIFVIGDFTAMIGDPTGKSETRKPLTKQQVEENAITYQNQVFKILDKTKTTVRYNSEWLGKLTSTEMVQLAAHYNVARMLEREDFKNRFQQGVSISIHEFLYPLLQGYDSVALNCDVEIGGTDQKFNFLVGRHLQKEYGQNPQTIVTVPILEGLDGVQKMSKSLNNHIGIMEPAQEIFGKTMSIPDELIIRYFKLLTSISADKIQTMEHELAENSVNPKMVKEKLAMTLVEQVHSTADAESVRAEFNRVFGGKQLPSDMPEIIYEDGHVYRIDNVIVDNNIITSKKEIQRLVQQGAIQLDGQKIDHAQYEFKPQVDQVLKIGKRRFFKFKVQS